MDGYPFERPAPQRTQRPRPVFYKGAPRPGWQEIGIRSYADPFATGLVPTGNNLYATLLRDFNSPAVTLYMYGWISGGVDFTEDYYGNPLSDPSIPTDEPFWFSRRVSRSEALDFMQGFANAQIAARNQDIFLRDLGNLTGYQIVRVETVRIVPSYGYRGAF